MVKNYFTIVFVFFLLGNIYSQTTAIPDVHFEQALILLGIDKSGILDGSVTTSDISGITTLNIREKNISDLTGIKDFMSLKILDCSLNQLTSLDISQNSNLEELVCNFNLITNLNVNGADALINLVCDYNQIANLDVSQNFNLEELDCMNNPLSNLDVSGAIALTHLYCPNNSLTSLDVSKNTALTHLRCENNQLTSLDLSQNTALIYLRCEYNQLTNLDVSKNVNLELFYSYENQITSLDVSKNIELERFWCWDNKITMLNIKNGTNWKITHFDAQNNLLTCIQVDIPADANAGIGYYSVWLKDATATYSDDCGYALGIDDELLAQSLSLYPNPVTNILTIDSEISLTKVEIYSILGKKVKEINSDFKTIPTDDLSNGVYIVRIHSANGLATKKLIKN